MSGLLLATGLAAAPVEPSRSVYESRIPDPNAVCLERPQFDVTGDGEADDTAALQAAIDRVQETTVRGIVLVPSGRYRLTRTLHVWSGIRLVGFGATRPVFLLGARTPGFSESGSRYLVHFVSNRPKAGEPVRDANPGTFYSAMSNIDIEIGPGNPSAVGVRFHVAQHGFLAHMDFRTGEGLAGVEEIGNELHDCRFFEGRYGILTTKPSPSWPFVLMDAEFEGQREAAIRTEEAGMTIVRTRFRRVPIAVTVNPGRAEELFLQDCAMEAIEGPAIVVSEETNARMQLNLLNVTCAAVPTLVHFRESGRTLVGAEERYVVRSLSHGQHIDELGARPRMDTRADLVGASSLPAMPASDVARLPPVSSWVSARALGAVGDGTTDDTEALRRALATSRTVFLPAGFYRVTDTLELRPDTVLVGMNPITTQIVLADRTDRFLGHNAGTGVVTRTSGVRSSLPESQGTGEPKPLLLAPRGGSTVMVGIGLDTGINHRAVAAKWMAGATSLMDDVRFLGGHGTYRQDGSSVPVYNNNRTGDADPTRRWDSQYWSLWVTDGGGGTFRNLWTPNAYAQAGMYVSNTKTQGRVYAMSSEHHVRTEVKLKNVENWSFYALQFEEERGEGARTLPLEIEGCRNLLFANLYLYRVMTSYSPVAHAVRVSQSSNLTFCGVHVYSPSKFTFDCTLFDTTSATGVRTREIARMQVASVRRAEETASGAAPSVRLTRLSTAHNNVDQVVAAPGGAVYFLDARWQEIWEWTAAGGARVVRDHPLEPVAMVLDTEGRLIVLTRIGTVYTFDPRESTEAFQVLAPEDLGNRSLRLVWPTSRWRDEHAFLEKAMVQPSRVYVGLDKVTAVVSDSTFEQAGFAASFYSTIDLIRSYGLAAAEPGKPFYVADEFGQKTYRFRVSNDGALLEPRLIAEEGEAAVVADAQGRVYVAAGDIVVYSATGAELERIEVPERPTSLAVSADGTKLYVGARSSLYVMELPR